MVIHHIKNLEKSLEEMSRIIKENGYLYIREHDVHPNNICLRKYLIEKH